MTSLPWITHYGCQYVVHGDDITSDSSGEDCYRYVKAAGRFVVVKRTPGISTTDLVGRMLLCTKGHFIKSLTGILDGEVGTGNAEERQLTGHAMYKRIRDYATDSTGLHPGAEVWSWAGSKSAMEDDVVEEAGAFTKMVSGVGPRVDQRIVYVDGGFDLFSSGHIEFLRQVIERESALGRETGWYDDEACQNRTTNYGENYGPSFIIAGVHDDEVINHWKGVNYPIMNIFERGLCVLQCKYINAIIFSAPFTPTEAYLRSLPYQQSPPHAVYHGPTSFMPLTYDPYVAPKAMGIFHEVGEHAFQNVNAEEIVNRIMKSRAIYEERQRKKNLKAAAEKEAEMRARGV